MSVAEYGKADERRGASNMPRAAFRAGAMVRVAGVEPALLSEPDFESGASTNSTTPACRAGAENAVADVTYPLGRFSASARRGPARDESQPALLRFS